MEESSTYIGKHLIGKILFFRVIENSTAEIRVMEESSIYRGKKLIGKNFLLRVIENSSCRNLSYGRNITWKRYEFFFR
jgi:hypothetical protein